MHKNVRKGMRKAARDSYVKALQEGRKERSNTFVDKKKESSRKAARGRSAINE